MNGDYYTQWGMTMRGIVVFLKYQYKNKALLWVVIMALVSFAFTYVNIRELRAASVTGLCAKDMLLISWPVSTMLYIGISVIKTMILTYIDNKPNILIRYNSKKRIFIYQCASALIVALADAVIMYVVSIISAYILLGVYDNWSEWGSMFYIRAMRRKLPLDIGISDICIYFNMIIRRALMIWLVSIVGLLSEMRLGKLRSVIIVVILICAYSCYSRYGVMWLELEVMQMYYMSKVIVKTLILLAVCMTLVISGAILSKKRQYYK